MNEGGRDWEGLGHCPGLFSIHNTGDDSDFDRVIWFLSVVVVSGLRIQYQNELDLP